MTDLEWVYMTNKLQDIALFSRLVVRRANKDDKLPSQHLELLSALAIKKEKVTPMSLSKIMGVNKTIISRIIDKLVKQSYLVKEIDESDKRSYFVYMTEEGEKVLDEIYKHYLQPIYDLRKALGEDDFLKLIELIEKANIKMNKFD